MELPCKYCRRTFKHGLFCQWYQYQAPEEQDQEELEAE